MGKFGTPEIMQSLYFMLHIIIFQMYKANASIENTIEANKKNNVQLYIFIQPNQKGVTV